MGWIRWLPVWGWMVFSLLCYLAGEVSSKLWANVGERDCGDVPWLIVLIELIYGLSILGWLAALMQRNELANLATLWAMAAALSSVLAGVLLFHEQPTPSQWLGLVLALIVLYLLS